MLDPSFSQLGGFWGVWELEAPKVGVWLQKMQRFFDGPYFGKSALWMYLVTMFSQLGGFWGWAESAG